MVTRTKLESHDFAQAVVASLPLGVIVLDSALRIVANNARATEFVAPDALGLGPGDALRCDNATLGPRGCGSSPRCADCSLRQLGRAALDGATTHQREITLSLDDGQELILLLSAAPLQHDGQCYALLTIQNVSALHRLKGWISICASCKAVAIDRESDAWQQVEAYVQARSHAEFTHTFCPECAQRLYGLRAVRAAEQR